MRELFPILIILMIIPLFIHSQNAPVTQAGHVTDAIAGNTSVTVPVTVAGFNDIGQFTLTMKFDTTRVRFVSSTTNPLLPGMTVTYSPPSENTQGKLIFAWNGSINTSLADSSVIASLTFHYVTGTGNLNWSYTFGSVCQYKTYIGSTLTILNDSPKYEFYLNGGISDRSAPQVFAPVIANPVPGVLQLQITTNGFTTIGAFTLYLEYDPSIITYTNSFTKNAAFSSAFQVGSNPGNDGKMLVLIQWYGNAVSLANGSTICTLNFNYPVANCNPTALEWFDNGPSCEFSDGLGNVLIDLPQSVYYNDGIVPSGLLNTWTGTSDSSWNNAGNWNECGIPGPECDIIIPNVSPLSFPIISSAVTCRSIRVENGAALTISTSGTVLLENE